MRLQLQGLCGRAVRQIEKRLNLCVPGGKETARMLKQLYRGAGRRRRRCPSRRSQGRRGQARLPMPRRPAARATIPSYAAFLSRRRLNKPGSEKETWHVEIDLSGTGLDYVVGDSFGVFPANDPALVDARARGARRAAGLSRSAAARLREVLTDGVSLSPAPDMLFQLISYITGGERRQKAKALAAGEDPDGDAATLDVLAALHKFPGIRPDPEAFIEALDPLQPRLYSISSSPKVAIRDASRSPSMPCATRSTGACGSASARPFSAAASRPATQVRVYVQKAQHFALPGGSGKADHHDRAWHRRRAVPRVPA